MPTKFDPIFRKLAKDMVALFGVTNGMYNQISPGKMNDDTNTVQIGQNSQKMQMSPPLRYARENVDGTKIRSDDSRIYIAAPDFEDVFSDEVPKTDDTICVNEILFKVIKPHPIYSGDQVAAYRLQCRRGHAEQRQGT